MSTPIVCQMKDPISKVGLVIGLSILSSALLGACGGTPSSTPHQTSADTAATSPTLLQGSHGSTTNPIHSTTTTSDALGTAKNCVDPNLPAPVTSDPGYSVTQISGCWTFNESQAGSFELSSAILALTSLPSACGPSQAGTCPLLYLEITNTSSQSAQFGGYAIFGLRVVGAQPLFPPADSNVTSTCTAASQGGTQCGEYVFSQATIGSETFSDQSSELSPGQSAWVELNTPYSIVYPQGVMSNQFTLQVSNSSGGFTDVKAFPS